jgi:hypothetical protein
VGDRSVARVVVPVLALAALAACGLDPSYDGTRFRCPASDPACPPGFVCVEGVCEPTSGGADARPDAGATPDGPADVCALAALAPDNDLCSGAIDLTAAAHTAAGATAYGDTAGYAGNLNPSIIATCTGAMTPGADAVYQIDAAAAGTLMLELVPLDWDGAVYVLDACNTGATCLGGADDLEVGTIETASIALPAAGTYYIVVDSRLSGADGTGCFTLRARL